MFAPEVLFDMIHPGQFIMDTSIFQQVLSFTFSQIWTSPVQYLSISIYILIIPFLCIPLTIYPFWEEYGFYMDAHEIDNLKWY